jgi:hypothetical protein
MKNILFYFYCAAFSLYVSLNANNIHSDKHVESVLHNNIVQTDGSVITKFDENLFVKIKVSVFSIDSIIVNSTFINNSKNIFYLYKPLLPTNDLLKENLFDFIIEEDGTLENKIKLVSLITYTGSRTGKYYEEYWQSNPYVIPELKKDNFLLLGVNDSIKLHINLSKFYNFKPVIAKGINHFSVIYEGSMPFINEKFEQIFELDKKSNTKKPVFYSITAPKSVQPNIYVYERAYFLLWKN